jgi:uncharacterized membrane protein
MVQIPDELKALLAIGITVIVTQVLKALSAQLKYDLSGYAAQITAAIVGAILVLANAVLTNVPAEFAEIVNQALVLVVVVLGSFGAYKVIKG